MFFEKRLFNLALHAMQNTNQTVCLCDDTGSHPNSCCIPDLGTQ